MPVLDRLAAQRTARPRAFAKCLVLLRRLASQGHELRRPVADYLRDGIYELRAREGNVNHRLLYFFHERHCAVLAEAVTKEGRVPTAALERALRRKRNFEADPHGHTAVGGVDHA